VLSGHKNAAADGHEFFHVISYFKMDRVTPCFFCYTT